MEPNIDILPNDTDISSAVIQLDVLKKMDINARAEMTFQLSDNLRSIVESGIRQRHPDYSPDQVKKAALSLVVDADLLRQIFDGDKVIP